MENELLAFEVRFLKAQLAEAERSVAETERLKDRLEESERSKAQLEERLAKAESAAARLEGAEGDLVSLLRRLKSSPLGPLLRRKEGFRTLEQRYLGTDA